MGACAGKNHHPEYQSTTIRPKKSRKEKRRLKRSQKKQKSKNGFEAVNPIVEERLPLSPKGARINSSESSTVHKIVEGMLHPQKGSDHIVNDLPAAHSTEDNTHNSSSSTPVHFNDKSNVHALDDVGNHDVQNESFVPTSPGRKTPTSPLRRMFHSPKMGGPRVLFKSPLGPKQLAFRREKNNSTSSLFVKDTINSPDTDEIIRCMAVALLYHIKNGVKSDMRLDTVFSEILHPLTRETLDLVNIPDVNTIYKFVFLIFKVQRLPPECAILCIAYLEKVLMSGKIVLHPSNWRRLVFSSIMLATKVWEDESVWNVDFLDVFPLLTILDLNKMENRFLEYLQFNVITSGAEYAKYYFELRALSQGERFPLEPLNRETQARLEERSQKTNAKVVSSGAARESIPKRCKSVDNYELKSPNVTLH